MRLWRFGSNHGGRTRRRPALFGALGVALNMVLCLAAGPAATWPRQVGPFVYAEDPSTFKLGAVDTISRVARTPVQLARGPLNPNASLVVTPDGKKIYVGNRGLISVVDAASAVGLLASPDGKTLYVSNDDGYLDAVDVGTRKLSRFAAMGIGAPSSLAMVPPPPGLPYASFRLSYLEFGYGAQAGADYFNYYAETSLAAASDGIRPDLEGLTLNIGGYVASVPPDKFKKLPDGSYEYNAWINGVAINAYVRPQGGGAYSVHLLERNVTLPAIANPVQAVQTIGNDSGLASVQAIISGSPARQAMR